ncbi:MAG: phage minor capsid protein [Ruminococcus sp.]|nr:phage minor capsid protein [Ruminococcus sp.]
MGLSPQYYDGCIDDVLNLYAELEDRIIADVVRRIVKTGNITETTKWQIRQAQQVGFLYDDIVSDIAKSTNKTDAEVRKMFENAGVETVNNDNRIHIKAGFTPLDIRQSESILQILNGVYKNSLTDLKNLTGTTAITSQNAYYQACNSALMMVSSGAFSHQQALRTVIQEVAQNGATVLYPSGHVDKLDVAVRRSLLTGIGLASRQISEENSRLCGCDLMEISAHSGARPSHSAWQGQIVSLSGRRGYLSKSDIGYGTGAGFGGWNCRHDWYPFYEGISERNYTQSDLEKLNAKDIEYNGKMYSEYEISQMLRQKERNARALKREQVAYKTAIEEGQDLSDDLRIINQKIRENSKDIQDFCNATGYKRDRFREQVGGKTSVGHGSGKTQKYINTLKNGLTSARNGGNIKLETEYRSSYDKNNKYSNRGIELPEKLQDYLKFLTKENDYIEGEKNEFPMKDLSSLSKETGVEFARITIKDKTYLIRGSSRGTNISNDMLESMKKYNGTLDYHSHPHDDDNVPSQSDLDVMALLENLTGQQESQIVTTNGKTTTYNKYGIVSIGTVDNTISDEDKKMFEELFGGLF